MTSETSPDAPPLTEMKYNRSSSLRRASHLDSPPDERPEIASSTLTLYIYASQVSTYAEPRKVVQNDDEVVAGLAVVAVGAPFTTDPDALLGLLHGSLTEFEHFAREHGCLWLRRVAKGICSNREGTLRVRDPGAATDDGRFHMVADSDALIAADYLYVVGEVNGDGDSDRDEDEDGGNGDEAKDEDGGGTYVALTKICRRYSVTSVSSTGSTSTMGNKVRIRDGQACWVSGMLAPLVNSHIIPVRVGDATARHILATFDVPEEVWRDITIFDPRFRCTLFAGLDPAFSMFEFGFYGMEVRVQSAESAFYSTHVLQSPYVCHDFGKHTAGRVMTTHGLSPEDKPGTQVLHLSPAGPADANAEGLPPPAVFQWHYLQCVIRRFGHPNYVNRQRINLPLAEPRNRKAKLWTTPTATSWPTAVFDLQSFARHEAREKILKADENAKRTKRISQWLGGVG